MSRNTAIKFFTVTNIGTNAQTIVRATNEDEALEVWARGLGRASFGAACELIGVHPEDIEVEEGEEVAEVLAASINGAKSLGAMWKAIQEVRAEDDAMRAEVSSLIRWDALPTWGNAPSDTDGVWSYDPQHLLVGEGWDLSLKEREDAVIIRPEDVKIYTDDGNDLPDTIECLIEFGDDGEREGVDPGNLLKSEAGRARLAALCAAVGFTMGDPDGEFGGLSEEDTIVLDPSDGLLVLYVHPNKYAWEVEA